MYRPTITQLIRELEAVKAKHGDLEIVGYNERYGELEDVGAEMNNDEGPMICLLTVAKAED